MKTVRTNKLLAGMGIVCTLLSAAPMAVGQEGRASWYALRSKTANGEMMNPSDFTAAHPSLPFGTRVTVTNLDNGRTAVVRINDRGPFVGGRVIDVSKAAAEQLGFIGAGTARVRLATAGGGEVASVQKPARTEREARPEPSAKQTVTTEVRGTVASRKEDAASERKAEASTTGPRIGWVDGKPQFIFN